MKENEQSRLNWNFDEIDDYRPIEIKPIINKDCNNLPYLITICPNCGTKLYSFGEKLSVDNKSYCTKCKSKKIQDLIK